jgi:hypothetical protein
MDFSAWIWLLLLLAAALVFSVYGKTGRFFRCALLGAATGLAALGALWLAGHFFELAVRVTPLTVAVSALLGIPGVVGMLLLVLI